MTDTTRGQQSSNNKKARRFGELLVGAQGRTRTGTDFSTRPSNVRVYQFRHLGKRDHNEPSLLLRRRRGRSARRTGHD
jgi:hypothetical protein